MLNRTLKTSALLSFLLFVISCHSESNFDTIPASLETADYTIPPAVQLDKALETSSDQQATNAIDQGRKLIKEGILRINVSNIDSTRTEVLHLTGKFDAYVAQEESSSRSGLTTKFTIRVASNSFDEFVEQVRRLAKEIEFQQIEVDDKTSTYVDVQARLSTKRKVVDRYTELLKRADSIGDVLVVEREIQQVIEQIERAERTLKSIEDLSSFSTLHLEMKAIVPELVIAEVSIPGFWSKAGDQIAVGWSGLTSVLLGLLTIWPLLIIAAGIAYVGWFRFRHRLA